MAISVERRGLIVHQIEQGYTQIEVAENLRVSQSTVSGICKLFRERGDIQPLKPTGRRPTYTEEDLLVLKAIVNDNPDLILVEYASRLGKALRKPVLSQSAIQRMMVKIGFTRKKKSKYAQERDTPENKKKKKLR